MRIPDPIANTTTEAYLAYKAGVLSEGDLKPKLYDPYIHLDAWLAYWAGLTTTYPVKGVGKNLCNGINEGYWVNSNSTVAGRTNNDNGLAIKVKHNTYYSVSTTTTQTRYRTTFVKTLPGIGSNVIGDSGVARDGQDTSFYRNSRDFDYLIVNATDLSKIQVEEGSTATAYEPYTGEPEMLTDEEALIAYLSGVTDTYPEEFRDPADVRVAAYLKYLVSARWGRPEYPVTNEELYLSMMDAPYIPAGEPSSDIEIDDTAEAPFKDVKMYGDTSQQTYTGKNLYNVQTKTHHGITMTVNADGSLSIKGTAADAAYIINETKPISLMENGETYTCWISGVTSLPTGVEIRLGVDNEGSWLRNLMSAMSGSTLSRTFTANTAGGDAIRCEVYVARGTTVDVSGIKVQLEKGSTATSFEPYVGGVPAPNPDYPQAVNTVTGRQVVKVEGKNLYKWNDVKWSNPITTEMWCFQNGSSTAGGGAYGPNITDRTPYKITLPAGTYKATAYNISSNIVNIQACKNGTPSEVIITNPVNINSSSPTSTITLTEETTLCFRYRVTNPSLGIGDTKIQLEKGSTATDFIPYQSGEYELNLGKNLFDKSAVTTGYRLGSNGLPYGDPPYCYSDFIPVLPSTTYAYSRGGLNPGGVAAICYYDASQAFISRDMPIIPIDAIKGTVTTPSNAAYVRIADRTTLADTIQFELGSTSTQYSAYFTPIELCKIGDYQDYIYKSSGKWYVHKAVEKIALSSLTGWGRSENGKFFATSFASKYGVVAGDGYSDQFDYSGTAWSADYRFGITGTGNLWVATGDSTLTSTDLFNTWLQNHNPVAYFQLATPTDTEITNTALIDQLNALKKGGSYTGTTYIKVSATDPNLPGLLEVEAYKYD